ncbi:MAG: aldehyde dehydrogenase family protein, partial [Beijerinckiaceae bacterium]|nr:aldehyde dehydrogenase family protein [Beijerinckiaceae bacterium]
MTDIVCTSPIDGSEVARRSSASQATIDTTLRDARIAQKIWAKVPLAERATKLTAFVDAMLTMNQEVVPEIAQQMGRPVKWGGEFRGFEERARHMIK